MTSRFLPWMALAFVCLMLATTQSFSASAGNSLRCDPRVCEEWVLDYQSHSRVTELEVGQTGDIFAVSVLTNELTRFDPSGDVIWEYDFSGEHEPSGLAIDGEDNTYVSSTDEGTAECDGIRTQKISPQGQTLWFTCTHVFSAERAAEVLLHESGSIYLAGETAGGYFISQLDSQGQEQWSLSLESEPGYGQASFTTSALDSDGSVYLTGVSDGDWLTIKVTSSGEEEWRHRLDGPSQQNDQPWDMAIADDHSVYATGQVETTNGDTDFLTVKYSPDGDIIWTREYSTPFEGPDGSTDIARALALDPEQNLIIAGGSSPGTALIKYSPDGDILWISHDCRGVLIHRMVVDESGGVVIVGEGPVAIRYGSDGSLLWRSVAQAPKTAFDRFEAAAIDGNVVYAGGDINLGGIITKYVGQGAPPALAGSEADDPLRCNELRGDVWCDNVIDSRDAIGLLLYAAAYFEGEEERLEGWCTGRHPTEYFALDSLNLDCSGDIDGADVLIMLRYRAGLPLTIPPGCPTFPVLYPDDHL